MRSLGDLHQDLAVAGVIPPGWEESVAAVDRALFIPNRFGNLDYNTDPAAWRAVVYSDAPVVTQYDDGAEDGPGVPTASSSKPSAMLEMLALLDVRDGMRVWEIGTGVGYMAAWLAYRLGDGNVVSSEVDPVVLRAATAALDKARLHPELVLGDALEKPPSGERFDRILGTCTLRRIPGVLLHHLVDEGRLVTPYGSSFHSYSYLTLKKRGREAHGQFSGNPAFMWARSHRGRTAAISDLYRGQAGHPSSTTLDPWAIENSADAEFFISRLVPDAYPVMVRSDEDGDESATYWLLADDWQSWATVEYEPDAERCAVEQYGPRRLWDEVEHAFRRWRELGRPVRERFGLTVTDDGHETVWLDNPAYKLTVHLRHA